MFILFQKCSTVNIYKYKEKYVLKEFLMLLMDRNFNPFATCILNKQGHIINGNIPVALRCVTFFSHTSEPTSVLFSYQRASNYITDNQYFSQLMFGRFVTFIDGNTALRNILVFKKVKRCVTIHVLRFSGSSRDLNVTDLASKQIPFFTLQYYFCQ